MRATLTAPRDLHSSTAALRREHTAIFSISASRITCLLGWRFLALSLLYLLSLDPRFHCPMMVSSSTSTGVVIAWSNLHRHHNVILGHTRQLRWLRPTVRGIVRASPLAVILKRIDIYLFRRSVSTRPGSVSTWSLERFHTVCSTVTVARLDISRSAAYQ